MTNNPKEKRNNTTGEFMQLLSNYGAEKIKQAMIIKGVIHEGQPQCLGQIIRKQK